MGKRTNSEHPIIKNSILLGIIFLLLHLADVTDIMSFVSRPMIIGSAKMLGISAFDRGNEIVLGKLQLPWTRDCSGINVLILLWGVILWANRSHKPGMQLLLRLFIAVPAALAANTARILSLAGYRYLMYPRWESQEMHFLIGFLCMLPFLALCVRDFRQMNAGRWLEVFYMAAVLSLLAPVVFSAGGTVVVICTLFFLSQGKMTGLFSRSRYLAFLIWALAAPFIGWARMESFWIPWLLVCPLFVRSEIIFSWSGLLILSGTISLLAMRPGWQAVVFAALIVMLYNLFRKYQDGKIISTEPEKIRSWEAIVLALLIMTPFVIPELSDNDAEIERPPLGVMANQLTYNSYKLRIPGQPADIAIYWYGAYGDGRHHSLKNCMRFQGVIVKKTTENPQIFIGGQKWMREYFIQNHELKKSYPEYILASFSPFSTAGVHLIIESPNELISQKYFAQESERLVNQLFRIYGKQQYF